MWVMWCFGSIHSEWHTHWYGMVWLLITGIQYRVYLHGFCWKTSDGKTHTMLFSYTTLSFHVRPLLNTTYLPVLFGTCESELKPDLRGSRESSIWACMSLHHSVNWSWRQPCSSSSRSVASFWSLRNPDRSPSSASVVFRVSSTCHESHDCCSLTVVTHTHLTVKCCNCHVCVTIVKCIHYQCVSSLSCMSLPSLPGV